ncbi:hypothetical protein Tco_0000319 [Tanacetum coccineum]
METIHVQFDELTKQMAPMQLSIGPAPTFLTPGQISSGLVPNPVLVAPYVPPTNKELEILLQPIFNEYLEPPHVERPVYPALAVLVPVNSGGTPSSTTIDQDAPSLSRSLSSSALQSPCSHQGVAARSTIIEDNPFAPNQLDIISTNDDNPFVAPPLSDTVLKYVNTLGYPSTLRNVSAMYVGKDGREIFGMPIPDALLTDEIKGSPYFSGYVEYVAEYQSKVTKPVGDKATKPTSTQTPKPKPTPTQPSKVVLDKKQKLVKETPDEPSPAKRSKGRLVGKRRKPKSPLRLVDEPSDEGVLVEEPAYNEEEANICNGSELSLHDQGKRTQGPATYLCQAGPNPGNQDEGQAGPSPSDQDEDQAGSNPGDAVESQPQSSHVVPAGPNLEHMDLEATDASTQQKPEQMDEEFTTTAYLNI